MGNNHIKRIGCALLAIVLLTLCGCGLIRQTRESVENEKTEMNALLVRFMTCIENNDVEGAAALAYDADQMRRDFPALRESWPARASDPYELKNLDINANIAGSEDSSRTVQAVYQVFSGGEIYRVVMVRKHDKGGSGILSLNAERGADVDEPITGNGPVPGKTFMQWCFTGFWILCCLFCVFTIIDIIRKKPKLYGLWIVIALVFVGFYVFSGNNNFQLGFKFGLLNLTEWIRYYGGANRIQVCLPLGSILYWLLRKRLLKQPAPTVYAVPAEPPQSPESE